MIGSVKRGTATGKRRVLGVFFLPEMALRSLKTARGSERGDRFEPLACQVADLSLEMTEDALSEAVSLRPVCLGVGPLSLPRCRFRFLGPPGFGGTTKATKGDSGLGSFD